MHETAETARLTADVVAFATSTFGDNYVLLIKRRWDPYEGYWALPGGHVDVGEDAKDAARRELKEETGLTARDLDYVDAYHAVDRDPRGRYVTFAYVTELDYIIQPTAADDAVEAKWFPLDDVLADGFPLAFDHRQIVADSRDLAL